MKYRFTEPIEKKRSSSYGTNYYVCKSRNARMDADISGIFPNIRKISTDITHADIKNLSEEELWNRIRKGGLA